MPTLKQRPMSDEHKAALVAGRSETKAVRDYLAAVQSHVRKPGRQRTLKSVRAQLVVVQERLAESEVDPVDALLLSQERMNLEVELAHMEEHRLEALETRFIAVAKSFSDRNGLSWDAWRAAEVPAPVLRRAGIQPR